MNRKVGVFHQNNARSHTILVTWQKLLQLQRDILPHTPYFSDLTASDYYVFRSVRNFVEGKTSRKVKNFLDQFFARKKQKFYQRGIMLLLERWRKVINQNG